MIEVRCEFPDCKYKEHVPNLSVAGELGLYHSRKTGHPGKYIVSERMDGNGGGLSV